MEPYEGQNITRGPLKLSKGSTIPLMSKISQNYTHFNSHRTSPSHKRMGEEGMLQ